MNEQFKGENVPSPENKETIEEEDRLYKKLKENKYIMKDGVKMKKNYIFWIIIITAVLSFFAGIGIALSYWGYGSIVSHSENPLPHELANLFMNNLLFRFWQIACIFITIYFIIKKVPIYIIIIPAVLAFMGLPFVLFITNILHFGGPVIDLLYIMIYIGLAVYSVAVLAKAKE